MCTWPQMNMSSVASEIWLLPSRTLARTASMICLLGKSIWGLRSGRQNLQRRPQPVVISTTPKVVRLAGVSSASRVPGMAHLHEAGQGLAADGLAEQFQRLWTDSLRPSTTQSTPSSSKLSVWEICQPPEPPTITLKSAR